MSPRKIIAASILAALVAGFLLVIFSASGWPAVIATMAALGGMSALFVAATCVVLLVAP